MNDVYYDDYFYVILKMMSVKNIYFLCGDFENDDDVYYVHHYFYVYYVFHDFVLMIYTSLS